MYCIALRNYDISDIYGIKLPSLQKYFCHFVFKIKTINTVIYLPSYGEKVIFLFDPGCLNYKTFNFVKISGFQK